MFHSSFDGPGYDVEEEEWSYPDHFVVRELIESDADVYPEIEERGVNSFAETREKEKQLFSSMMDHIIDAMESNETDESVKLLWCPRMGGPGSVQVSHTYTT
jgi:hypothetical protein